MPSAILNLKFKGNKSFVAFSNLGDTESLTKTWKVCSKVASYLEQGQRLENLSWRLWHLQNIMVESDNAKSKREFKKLSKTMGDKLDKEKGRAIEELQAPGFKRNPAAEKLRQRAEEKERSRIESAAAADEGRPLKRMQFTFAVDHPAGTHLEAAGPVSVKKPDLKPSSAFRDTVIRRMRPTTRAAAAGKSESYESNAGAGPAAAMAGGEEMDPPSLTEYGRKRTPPPQNDAMNVEDPSLFNDASSSSSTAYSHAHNEMNNNSAMNFAQTAADVASSWESAALRFPSLFTTDFGPAALLFPQPSLATALSYGEDVSGNSAADDFRISRPTIELPLDEILNDVDPGHSARAAAAYAQMQQARMAALSMARAESPDEWSSSVTGSVSEDVDMKGASSADLGVPPMSQAAREALPSTIHPSQVNGVLPSSSTGISNNSPGASVSTPRGGAKPTLSVRTSSTAIERTPGATVSGAGSIVAAGNSGRGTQAQSTAPGGVKAECSNCGATHTPLWRRGLNDELNCNACGLYCKLHKRPRPKSMRSQHGEGRHQSAPRSDNNEAMGEPAQCYNCHTVATPLWRKDDEGKTVCNACGLYFKLHGSARPISMKSDIIRKRSRHDARRVGSGETPSASPGASRRASPVDGVNGQQQGGHQHGDQNRSSTDSPTLEGNGALGFGFGDDYDFANPTPQSELMGALGTDPQDSGVYSAGGAFDSNIVYSTAFPGPYHPDYLQKTFGLYHAEDNGNSGNNNGVSHDANANDGVNGHDEDRANKRRRMSVDSASEPPSSSTSSSYYATEGSSATTTSARSSMDFASTYGSYPPYNTSGTIRTNNVANNTNTASSNSHTNNFWHPPLLPQDEAMMKSPHAFGTLHPPLLPGAAGNTNGTGAGGDFPMDFLHPPLLPQEEHDLFARYLHPPMVLGEDSPMPSLHPPLLPPNDAYYAQAAQVQAQVQAVQAAVNARAHGAQKHAQAAAQHQHQQHQQHQQQAQGDYYEQNFGGFNGAWAKEY